MPAALVACLAGLLLSHPHPALGQSIEPRAYSNAPVGTNFLIAGYAATSGGLAFDTALPLTDPDLETSSLILAYARALDLWGKSGKIDMIVPYTDLSGTARFDGDPVERDVTGFADPLVRMSVNLLGAPALDPVAFRSYRQDLIVGVSLQVSVPAGQYNETRLVNLGMNRWSFKPEIGASKALGPWTIEGQASVTLFTDNNEFFNDREREQEPLYQVQTHAIYNFRPGVWGSLDATYFTGGRTTLDDVVRNDLQRNWRLGATLSLPLSARNSFRLYASRGVSARTGNNFDLVGAAWQYRWGADP